MDSVKCKVVSFANSKGGIGKSTTCQNIGVILSQLGYRVLCVDMDSQAHLSVAFGIINPEELDSSLTDLINNIITQKNTDKDTILNTIITTNTVDLLPATFQMDALEVSLNAIVDREYALADIIKLIKEHYDYILIDCNSARNIFTTNALACSDEVIIPSQTQHLSTGGIPLMLSTIQTIKRRVNPSLKIKGILLTMYQSITNQSKETVEIVRDMYKDMVFKTIIPSSTKVPDAQRLGLSVVEFDVKNPVSISYVEFVRELLKYEE